TYVSRVLESDRIIQSIARATQDLVKVREQDAPAPQSPIIGSGDSSTQGGKLHASGPNNSGIPYDDKGGWGWRNNSFALLLFPPLLLVAAVVMIAVALAKVLMSHYPRQRSDAHWHPLTSV